MELELRRCVNQFAAPLGAYQARLRGRCQEWAVSVILQYVVPLTFLVGATAWIAARPEESRAASLSLLGWKQFEAAVGEAFRRRGFEVSELGAPTADRGVDLILTRGGQRLLVQCKQWRAEPVTVDSIRQLHSAMLAEGAVGGYVVTAGEFAKDAREFARQAHIELIDERGIDAFLGVASPPRHA
jgi:restriction system protein